MIHGYIGAGKTCFAKELQRRHSAWRFTHDEWMVRLYGRNPPADVFEAYAARVSGLIDSLWPEALKIGADVVLDLNFWTRAHRDRVRALIAEAGAECRLYAFECNDEEAIRRIAIRNADENTLLVSPESYQALKCHFEPLDADEELIAIRP